MKTLKNKIAAITIATFFILSMTASIMLIPNANAHTPAWKIPTYAYITVSPNPIGVNQQAYIIMWLDEVFDNALPINNYRFENYKLTITAPNGSNTTQTFAIISDPSSNQDYKFTPTSTGTYTLTFSFPGQLITASNDVPTSSYVGDTYQPSSTSTTLVVQSTPIPPAITSEPLPTNYWTRPIYGENSNWYTISSNWLGAGSPSYAGIAETSWLADQKTFPTDAIGSMTSHIMWTKPLDSGGVVGGSFSTILGDTYFEGSAYLQRFTNPIILDGMLYYTEPLSFGGVPSAFSPQPYGPTVCVNLQTGQQIWSSTSMPPPSFGYIYDVQDPNQHGVYQPILIGVVGSTWEAFDAYTGVFMFNVTNVPSGVSVSGQNGEYIIYVLNNAGTPTHPSWYLGEWNSSRLWDGLYSGPSTSPSVVPPITDGSNPSLYDWNISMPEMNTMSPPYPGANPATIVDAFLNDALICYNGTLPSAGGNILAPTPSWTPYTYFEVDVNPASSTFGKVLWWNTLNPPAGNLTVATGPADLGAGVFTEQYKETRQYVGYSIATGQKVWGPTPSQTALDYYSAYGYDNQQNWVIYGNLYTMGVAGIVYCYNLTNGDLLWTYGNGGAGNSTSGGFNTPFQNYPGYINAAGNGVIYTVTVEHTVETPIFKGALARAINATTGAQIWTLSDYTGEFITTSYAMADGYNTFFNGYDNQVYVVGRGPSQTTVTAPDAGLTFGQPVVIRGTVTDVSAGTKQTEQAADFPNGVPCASDASMTAWMGYVYQQQAEPTNFTGVPVTITVKDSNNNCYIIGTTTTDESGTYSLTWTPIIPGNFTVYTTFLGTNGYWPSSAETTFNVMSAAPTASPYPSPPTGLASTSSLELGIAIVVIVIVIIGIAILAVLMRKRP